MFCYSNLDYFANIIFALHLVELESEQTDSVSFLANGRAGTVSLWFGDEIDDIPEWSSPPDHQAEISGVTSFAKQNTEENATVPEFDLFFAVLWKANVVNSDGTASTGKFRHLFIVHHYRDLLLFVVAYYILSIKFLIIIVNVVLLCHYHILLLLLILISYYYYSPIFFIINCFEKRFD